MADKVATPSPVVVSATEDSSITETTTKTLDIPKLRKPRVKPTHPKTAQMVNSAIGTLKERGGSSLQAIKKYITNTYKFDAEKHSSFIKKYIKAAVATGVLIQTKGKGAAGSFKLAAVKPEVTKPKNKPTTATKRNSLAKAVKTSMKKSTAVAKKPPSAALKRVAAKKTTSATSSEKRKLSKGPAAKPPKAKTTKAKVIAKTPPKKAVPSKKATSVAGKAKKPTPKKIAINKKK